MATCEHCAHEWHGLACGHAAVIRNGWFLEKQTCECAGAQAGFLRPAG